MRTVDFDYSAAIKVRLLVICLASAAAALLATPVAASAYVQPAQGPVAAFTVKGSHGYLLGVSIARGWSNVGVVQGSRDQATSSTSYSVHGEAPVNGRFEADLGRLGRIAVRFKPSPKVRRHKLRFCRGGVDLTRFGTFEGTIRFRGEGGYTEVDAERVAGTVTSSPRLVCHFPKRKRKHRHRGGKKPDRPLVTTLSASSDQRHLSLDASHTEGDPFAGSIFAVCTESEHGVSIFRIAFSIASKPKAFSFDANLDSATLTPGAPFSGSATYQRIDDYTSRWEGPLTVSFPGLPGVPLTGRDFSWSLSSGRRDAGSVGVGVIGLYGA